MGVLTDIVPLVSIQIENASPVVLLIIPTFAYVTHGMKPDGIMAIKLLFEIALFILKIVRMNTIFPTLFIKLLPNVVKMVLLENASELVSLAKAVLTDVCKDVTVLTSALLFKFEISKISNP